MSQTLARRLRRLKYAADKSWSTQIVSAPRGASTTLVAPSSFGSLGDQALILGALHGAREELQAIVPGRATPWRDVGIPCDPMGPVMRPITRKVTVQGCKRYTSAGVTVLGADTIDGAYDHSFLAHRVEALNLCARSGYPAKLVNFSLREDPSRHAISLLRKLDSTVELWARDTVSQQRATEFLGRQIRLSPDVGALMPPAQSVPASSGTNERRVVLVPNAHFASLFGLSWNDLVEFWVELASEVSSRDFAVNLLAHDLRPHPGDRQLVADVGQHCTSLGLDCETQFPQSAPEAKSYIQQASACIAARMHACVAALSSMVPTVGIEYLGKFEGQFDWYGTLGAVVPFQNALSLSEVTMALDRIYMEERVESALEPSAFGWL